MTESEKNLNLVSKFSLKPKMLSNSDAYYNNYNFHTQNSDLQMHVQDSKINVFNQMNLNVKPSPLLDSPVIKDGSRITHVPFGIANVWYVVFIIAPNDI